VQDVADAVRRGVREGREAVIGRVVDVKGFSTLPGDELIAIEAGGGHHGDLLGRPGAERLAAAASVMFAAGTPRLETVTIEIQSGGAIPERLWELLASRAPAALVTRIEGPSAGPAAMVVDRDGRTWGGLGGLGAPGSGDDAWTKEAVGALAAGRTSIRRLDDEAGVVLLEAWVPAPRLVVVGSGDLVSAITAQADLLGWETHATDSPAALDGLLDWAGATAALIVLSHDPHVDTPALAAGLARGVAYVGALGSRATQSRRLERLAASGVDAAALDRIHRPIGLDLGGRRPSEVALSITAEILACHCGRDARPLRDGTGPINYRPTPTAR
jgi:xanthine dehydrogenase accessory factor